MKKKLLRVLSIAMSAVLLSGVAVGCGGKDPGVEDTTSTAEGTTGSETAGTTGTDSTFTYAIGGDPGETVNVITTSDR